MKQKQKCNFAQWQISIEQYCGEENNEKTHAKHAKCKNKMQNAEHMQRTNAVSSKKKMKSRKKKCKMQKMDFNIEFIDSPVNQWIAFISPCLN